MKVPNTKGVFIAVLFLCLCIAPVSAVILEVTCRGPVSTVDTVKNTLTVKNPEQYGCEYPASGSPVCTWKPMSVSALTGTVPDASVFSVVKGGDIAVATSVGGSGGQWITIGKIYGPRETEQLVTDIIGDPRTMLLPLIGEYSLETQTTPDCMACTGTVCTAKQAKVTIRSMGNVVSEKTLAPGELFAYNGRNDGSSVLVKFVSGQAASQSCPDKAGMTGPQAISVFIIKLTPPVGFGQVNIRTATTTRPEEALTPLPQSTMVPTPSPTKSGVVLPAVVMTALGVAALLLRR